MKKWKIAFVLLCITSFWCPIAAAQQCWEDADGDGYGDASAPIACDSGQGEVDNDLDCDDTDVSINPDAVEIVGDGIDQDCDGIDPQDADGDGYISTATGGDDCNDFDASINPGATEIPGNGIDEDCDGMDGIPAQCWEDADGDGYGDASAPIACDSGQGEVDNDLDCDDTDVSINPDAVEIVGDGIDQDCDGIDPQDADGDGYISTATGGDDCNDFDASINPGATEIPGNGIDEDCDGMDGIPAQCWEDADGDGYGDASAPIACDSGQGEAANDLDCDDTRFAVNPDAAEVCDTIDNNCDGLIDDDDPTVEGTVNWCSDSDADGFGNPANMLMACGQPDGFIAECSDCDDTNAEIGGGCDIVFGDGFEGGPP